MPVAAHAVVFVDPEAAVEAYAVVAVGLPEYQEPIDACAALFCDLFLL
jgi:hypothetical protein